MKDEYKTKKQLISELAVLRKEIFNLKFEQRYGEYSSPSAKPSPSEPHLNTGEDTHNPTSYRPKPVNNNKYHISQLIDIPLLQHLSASFYRLTGISHTILDTENNIINRIGWQDICDKFHRRDPQTETRCKQSDSYILEHLYEGTYIKYKCLNGLIDYAIPIMVEGQHVGTIVKGQSFNDPPDENYFRIQAKEYGFDEEAYMTALGKVPIIPDAYANSMMDYFSDLAQVLASMGMERLQRLEAADQALILSEEKFSKVFHRNADPISITTLKEGRFLEVNEAYLKATGYKESEIIGHTSQELNVWDSPEERDMMVEDILKYGRIENAESKFKTKYGTMRTVLMSAETIKVNGETLLVISTRDISERKQMEEQLRLSEECFSKAFYSSPVIMAITTLGSGRYIKANQAFCRLMGCSEKEITEKLSSELFFWSDPQERDHIIERSRANESINNLEIHFCTCKGEQRIGLYSADNLELDGEVCLLSSVIDITELRQMEIEMTRLDRLNLVGEMAASIGHEIRNPMTTVRGYLQLLQMNEIYHSEMECFDLMIEELDRANSIITEFLALAKDKMVELQPTNINRLIGKLLPLARAGAMKRDQQIKLDLHDLPDLLLDHKEISQLILNLVNNGMEAMTSYGCITIRTFTEKEEAILAVQDQGQGISSDLLDKLGTPFITTKDNGTGLGLAVCYRIANRHNARINVDTNSAGTTFYVRFPLRSKPQ